MLQVLYPVEMTEEQNPADAELVRRTLAYRTVSSLLKQRVVRPTDSVLVIGAGNFDSDMFRLLELERVTLSNLNVNNVSSPAIKLDGGQLSCPDDSYDHVITRSTLHHMSRPHRAIHEMYRVCRKSVMFFESEDTALMRLLLRLKIAQEYEFNANLRSGGLGGVDDRMIPNYVYRWSRREIEKTVRSLDPTHIPEIRFFKSWEIETRVRRVLDFWIGDRMYERRRHAMAGTISRAANLLFPSQANNLGVVILKSMRKRQPWIKVRGGEEVFIHPSR